jgi:rhomboid protease GluP
MTEFVEVRCSATQREAEHLALVLAAVGIDCRLVVGRGGVGLCVASRDAEAARQQLDAYERENAPERNPAMDERTGFHGLSAAMAYALVLLFFFGAERRGA